MSRECQGAHMIWGLHFADSYLRARVQPEKGTRLLFFLFFSLGCYLVGCLTLSFTENVAPCTEQKTHGGSDKVRRTGRQADHKGRS